MTNNKLIKMTAIRKESLDRNNYILSLIQEGYRAGLIDQVNLDKIQRQIMLLLRDSILNYTSRESSSVKVETAQNILMSILYSIDAWLISIDHPEEQLDLLMATDIDEIYKKGLRLVDSCLAEAKMLYEAIKRSKLDVPIIAYNMTIDEALAGFFEQYDTVFMAQETMASIDYPLLFDDMEIQGIYYIKQYLEKLSIETQFCRYFLQGDIARLLFNYGQVYQIDYKEALINIFEVVLTNAIFSVLSGQGANELSISKYQYKILWERLKELDHQSCSDIINVAIDDLIIELSIDSPDLKEYIKKFAQVLMPRFLSALDYDSLANVIIIDSDERSQLDIVFDVGNRMDDDSFRTVIDNILESTDANAKINIISSSIHSLADFVDILEADCLFEDEFNILFNSLGDLELSILAKIVFIEEIRIDPSGFSLQKAGTDGLEMYWQVEFTKFLDNLNKERLDSISEYLRLSVQAV